MDVREQLCIDGAWVTPDGANLIDVIGAATEAVIGRIPEGTPTDVDRAVAALTTAFTNDMQIAPVEISGPVLSIIAYDDDDDAVAIVNDTPYGLAAGMFGADLARAVKVACRLQAGHVEVNGMGFHPTAPCGGYKQSGIGREYGAYGLEEFLEVKTLGANA